MNNPSHHLDFKVTVLGTSGVGKTSILKRYCDGTYSDDTISTMGANFFSKSLIIDETELSLSIWDTAGTERFMSIAPSFLRGSNALILVCDATKMESFDQVDSFFEQFLLQTDTKPGDYLPVSLLVNKSDMGDGVITREAISEWMTRNGVSFGHFVSAKTGEGVAAALDELARSLLIKPNADHYPLKYVVVQEKHTKISSCTCNV